MFTLDLTHSIGILAFYASCDVWSDYAPDFLILLFNPYHITTAIYARIGQGCEVRLGTVELTGRGSRGIVGMKNAVRVWDVAEARAPRHRWERKIVGEECSA